MECPWSSSSPSIAGALASLPQAINLPETGNKKERMRTESESYRENREELTERSE
jgi:hypothetical protein